MPNPWLPLEFHSNIVSCWGREYLFSRGALPRQIKSQGRDIFARPPVIILEVNGTSVNSLNEAEPKFIQKEKHKAIYRSTHTEESYRVEAIGSIEYDGFLRIDVTVLPTTTIRISSLGLNFPLRKDVATFFSRHLDYDFSKENIRGEDLLESFGRIDRTVEMKFNPALWIGNHDIGIEWSCETNEGWAPGDAASVIRLIPVLDHVVLKIDAIAKPMNIEEPYRFSFALYPTPIKPLPANWRNYTLVNASASPPKVNTSSRKVYGIAWPDQFPLKYLGLPIIEPTDTWQGNNHKRSDRNHSGEAPISPGDKITKGRDAMRRYGVGFIPYGTLYGITSNLPLGEWKNYGVFWSVFGRTLSSRSFQSLTDDLEEKRYSKWGFSYICPYPKSFRDFLVWQYAQAVEKYDIDGLYLDLSSPNVLCANDKHPHGRYVSEGGSYYPFFHQRELMQRLYVACRSKKPDFLLSVHHAKIPVVAAGFADIVVSGEPLARFFKRGTRIHTRVGTDPFAYVPDYSRLPDVMYEVQYSQKKGFISMLLPEIVKRNEKVMCKRPDLLAYYTRTLLARSVVYDIPLSAKRMDLDLYNRVVDAQERFGSLTGATYVGPWESSGYLESGGKDLKIALYVKPQERKLLLIVSNLTDHAISEEVLLSPTELTKLGFNVERALQAKELLEDTDQPSLDGRVKIVVPPQDFRLYMMQ